MGQGRILIVDDDPRACELLQGALQNEGYRVSTAHNGHDALELVQSWAPDLVVLDINLAGGSRPGEPAPDGMDVLRTLRKTSDACVLMITSTDISFVKVAALRIGADDFLTKPVDAQELNARVDAILRRARGRRGDDGTLRFQGLKIDPAGRAVWRGDAEVKLTRVEFDLLFALARRPGQVLTRRQLLTQAWEDPGSGDERVIDVHVGHLRKKIESEEKAGEFIATVWGKGYRFEGKQA